MIHVRETIVRMTVDLVPPGAQAWVREHAVEVAVRCRWQWQQARLALLDWEPFLLRQDGVDVVPGAIPEGMPAQQIINAVYSRAMRELLEAEPPEIERPCAT